MIERCWRHQQGPTPVLSAIELHGLLRREESIPVTPELAVSQDDMPPQGVYRGFYLEDDEVAEGGHRGEQSYYA